MMIRFFRHYVPSSILLVLVLEAAIFAGSIYVGAQIRLGMGDGAMGELWPKAVVFSSVMVVLLTVFGLYDNMEWEGGFRGMLLRYGAAATLGFVLMTLIFYLVPDFFLGRGVFLLSFILAIAASTLFRLIMFRWLDFASLKSQILVLGTGSRAARVETLLEKRGIAKRLRIIGYLAMGGTHHFVDTGKILHEEGRLLDIANRHGVTEIVIAIRDRRGGLPLEELLECKLGGIRVTELSAFFEREAGQLQLETLNAGWMIHSEGFQNGPARDINKRIFDICASAVLLLVTMPVMAVAALFVVLEDGFPVIYRQERVGQNDRVFTIYKFRSMRNDAEKGGTPKWAAQNDDRITRVGRILRKLRIDELPQIFNVLKGDMSFVGPRPERPYFVDKLAEEIPYYKCRHSVKPGITGWAQVRYAYGATIEDSLEKLQYDLYYLKNHSMFLDFMILFQTVQVVLWGKGAR